MKKIYLLLAVLFIQSNVFSQMEEDGWYLSFGVNAINNLGTQSPINSPDDWYFNSVPATLSAEFNWAGNFSIEPSLSYNQIKSGKSLDGGQLDKDYDYIALEGDLFNSGVRPAINVGISVSRVGGNAQIKSMKKVAGTLKLDQAQYRELEAFAKFGSDLDASTLNVIEKGKRNVEILKQAQNDPFTVEDQIAIIYAGSKNLLRNVPVEKVKEFQRDYIEFLNAKHRGVLDTLKVGKLTDEVIDTLTSVAKDLTGKYKA